MLGTHLPGNLYVQLLTEFRRAYAEFGHTLFFVGLVTREELLAEPRLSGCYLCHIPLADDGSGWCVVGARRRQPNTEAPWQRFRTLAAYAGAALPLAVRSIIPFEPADAVGWWMTFLWHLHPPAQEDLAEPDGVRQVSRAVWPDPFLESADAIESCQLHTDQPRFPPDCIAVDDSGRIRMKQAAGTKGAKALKTGRPPDPLIPKIVAFTRKLRQKDKMPWKEIPGAVFKRFKKKYDAETLRYYLKNKVLPDRGETG